MLGNDHWNSEITYIKGILETTANKVLGRANQRRVSEGTLVDGQTEGDQEIASFHSGQRREVRGSQQSSAERGKEG